MNKFKINCNICMQKYCNIESKIMLECDHTMCIKCLKKINDTTKKCPYCRKEIKFSLTTLNYILTYGIYKKCIKIVKYAIDNKADLNWKNDKGNTILHKAVDLDYYEGVKFLLEFGSSPYIINNENYLPIDYSINKRINKLFENYNNNLDINNIIVNENESTIKMIEEYNNSKYNNVKKLIKKGGNIYNEKFLNILIFEENEDFIEYLILCGLDPYYKYNNLELLTITKNIGNYSMNKIINSINNN